MSPQDAAAAAAKATQKSAPDAGLQPDQAAGKSADKVLRRLPKQQTKRQKILEGHPSNVPRLQLLQLAKQRVT